MSASITNSRDARRWQRFTPLERTGRYMVYVVVLAAFVASLRTVEIIP